MCNSQLLLQSDTSSTNYLSAYPDASKLQDGNEIIINNSLSERNLHYAAAGGLFYFHGDSKKPQA